jgi:ubiquinone/menaquinone biosynthesis C-methylase UbiE/uncharacterized protein YbaR (Trm112 family)
MKQDLIDVLSCPACLNAPLEMQVHVCRCNEIVQADLFCQRCGNRYSVRDGIPVMLLDADTRSSGQTTDGSFETKHREVRDANIVYYDAVAEVYQNEVEQSIHQGEENQRRVRQVVMDLSQKTPGKLFLDLGCGTGNLLKWGAMYFEKAVGVDVSFNMLRMARQNGLEVVQADALFLPFRKSICDVVSIFSVLHHIVDYGLVFGQVQRVLRSGGYLYSDWDPTRKPRPADRRVAWGIYRLVHGMFEGIRPLSHRLRLCLKQRDSSTDPIDFALLRPDLTETQAKAEFHNITRESCRGLDFIRVKSQLEAEGFQEIEPTYHQSGRTLNQLTGVPFLKARLLAGLGFDPEPFLENIQILARKRSCHEPETSCVHASPVQEMSGEDL